MRRLRVASPISQKQKTEWRSGVGLCNPAKLAEIGLDSGNRDVITDFNATEGDHIDLSTLDANTTLEGNQAFSYIGSAQPGTCVMTHNANDSRRTENLVNIHHSASPFFKLKKQVSAVFFFEFSKSVVLSATHCGPLVFEPNETALPPRNFNHIGRFSISRPRSKLHFS